MRSPAEHGGQVRADRLVVSAFVASGAAGLMYQVVWSRQLVLVFGNTTEAIGTIVTAFLAGLGLGGLVAGLIAPRLRRPLLVYGLVELAVGASALAVPVGFHLIEGTYRAAYDTGSAGTLVAARLGLTMATVTPVTFLMGLTLPLLTRHLVSTMRNAGPRMGQLYSANTAGAMAGTLLAGLVLIELLGLSGTAALAVALNLGAGAVGLGLALRRPAIATAGAAASQAPAAELGDQRAAAIPGLRLPLYAATFVSGFVALALEVLWTRMLAEGTGSLSYIFVVILAVYLLGIALGGALYRAAGSPRRDTPRALALAFCGIAASTLVSVPLATLLLGPSLIWRALVLLPGTVCMGYAFPLSARLLTKDPAHGSRSIGLLYAWNTAGSLAGSLAAAFLLAGSLGTNRSVLLLGAADAVAALGLVAAAARSPRSLPRGVSASAAALVLIPALLVESGSPLIETATQHYLDGRGVPYVHAEDKLSTADAVGGPVPGRRLLVSGTSMTYLSTDTKLMAYLPKVLRPHASDFLDIAFGMGTTYRSAINLGMRTVAVDLSPTVPRMMPVFYPDAERYLHSPIGQVVTADGRNYVRLTSRRFDIISVDPPPPIQSAGTGVLYSREFYADAHHVLKPGGLMLEWLYFGVSLPELKAHLRSFASVFPHVVVLISPMYGGVYLLGSDAPITWDAATAERILGSPAATRDIESAPDYHRIAGRSWPSVLDSMRWLPDGAVHRFTGDGPMVTDDRPRTEYYLLQHLFDPADRAFVNATELRLMSGGNRSAVSPPDPLP